MADQYLSLATLPRSACSRTTGKNEWTRECFDSYFLLCQLIMGIRISVATGAERGYCPRLSSYCPFTLYLGQIKHFLPCSTLLLAATLLSVKITSAL